eukprot:Pgem_evm1s5660
MFKLFTLSMGISNFVDAASISPCSSVDGGCPQSNDHFPHPAGMQPELRQRQNDQRYKNFRHGPCNSDGCIKAYNRLSAKDLKTLEELEQRIDNSRGDLEVKPCQIDGCDQLKGPHSPGMRPSNRIPDNIESESLDRDANEVGVEIRPCEVDGCDKPGEPFTGMRPGVPIIYETI